MERVAQNLLGKKWLVFGFFVLLLLMFYHATAGSGFAFDFISQAKFFSDEGLLAGRKMYMSAGFLPLFQALFFGLYKLFGLCGWCWLLFSLLFHAFNALLVYLLTQQIAEASGLGKQMVVSLLAALLFLLSPYQAEPLIWGAAVHYTVVGTCLLSIVFSVLAFAKTQNRGYIWLIALLQLLTLFMLEVALVFPLLTVALVVLGPAVLIHQQNRKQLLKAILPLQLIPIVIYFAASKWLLGVFFSHYGGSPISYDFGRTTSIFTRYLLKLGFFFNFFSPPVKATVYHLVGTPVFGWITFSVLVVSLGYLLYRAALLPDSYKGLMLLLFLFLVALAPFVTMHYMPIYFTGINDRYSYFASMFFFPCMAFGCLLWLKRYGTWLLGGFLLVTMVLLVMVNQNWAKAKTLRLSLMNDYRWYNNSHVYLLAFPSVYNGAWVFQSVEDGAFGKSLLLYTGKNVLAQTTEITQFNMTGDQDSVTVTKSADGPTVRFDYDKPNAWLSHNFYDLTSTETEYYKTSADKHHLVFTLKQPEPGAVYIYAVGGKWKEVKF